MTTPTQPTPIERWKKLFKAPFKYHIGIIFDAESSIVVDDLSKIASACRVRGWGRISSNIADEKLAEEIQDAFGNELAKILNEWYVRTQQASEAVIARERERVLSDVEFALLSVDRRDIGTFGKIEEVIASLRLSYRNQAEITGISEKEVRE